MSDRYSSRYSNDRYNRYDRDDIHRRCDSRRERDYRMSCDVEGSDYYKYNEADWRDDELGHRDYREKRYDSYKSYNDRLKRFDSTSPTKTLLLKGLEPSTSEEKISDSLKIFGPIGYVEILKSREGSPNGSAYAHFYSVEDAVSIYTQIQEAKSFEIQGKNISVQYCQPEKRRYDNSNQFGDWICPYCYTHNFSRRKDCFGCKVPRGPTAIAANTEKSQSHVNMSSIMIRGLPFNYVDGGIEMAIENAMGGASNGMIKSIRVLRDRNTNNCRGFAFVDFQEVHHAKELFNRTGGFLDLYGQSLTMEYSTSGKKSRGGNGEKLHIPTAGFAFPENSNFEYDTDCGFYKDTTSGLYYDPLSGYYFDKSKGIYYYYNQVTKAFVPWSQSNLTEESTPVEDNPSELKENEPTHEEKSQTEVTLDSQTEEVIGKQTMESEDLVDSGPVSFKLKKKITRKKPIIVLQEEVEEKPIKLPMIKNISKPPVKTTRKSKLEIYRERELLFDINDPSTLILGRVCLLCKRLLASHELVQKHLELSRIHQKNVDELLSKNFNEQLVPAYRDRAAERRALLGESKAKKRKDRIEDTKPQDSKKYVKINDFNDNEYDLKPPKEEKSKTHAPNVGLKIMKKMGYTGGGLGRKETGRTNPIHVSMRPERSGLGSEDPNDLKLENIQGLDYREVSKAKYKKLWEEMK